MVDSLDPGSHPESTWEATGIHPSESTPASHRISVMTVAFAPERIEHWPLASLHGMGRAFCVSYQPTARQVSMEADDASNRHAGRPNR